MKIREIEEKLPVGHGFSEWKIQKKDKYFRCDNIYHKRGKGFCHFSIIIYKSKFPKFNLHFHGEESRKLNRRFGLREELERRIESDLTEN